MPLTFDQVAAQVPSDLTTTRYPSTIDVNKAVTNKMESSLTVQSFTFPSDLPKHHFVIYEYEMTGAVARDLAGVYRLPLPSQLRDSKQIRFTTGFNIAHDAATLGAAASRALFGQGATQNAIDLLQQGAEIAGAATQLLTAGSLALNNFNWVTLSTPDFHRWAVNFILRPKTYEESVQIRDIVNRIKADSHPKKVNYSGGLVLSFPNIFVCSFNTPGFLYKFKPAVFESITAEHSTTMFKVDGQSVPEYTIVSISAMDIEIWTKDNFDGAATNGPFTAITNKVWYGA